MPITFAQLKALVNMVITVKPDDMDCDDCSDHIAEYAETQLLGKTVEESQAAVKTHLDNCPCCSGEFVNLLDALKELEEEEQE